MKKLFTLLSLISFSLTSVYSQNWQWAHEGQYSAADNEALGTSISNTGDVFVCGYYQTQFSLGGNSLTSLYQGDNNSFIAKYNSAGTVQWLRNVDGVQPDANSAMVVSSDTLGNCYVVSGNGYVSSTAGSLLNYASSYGGFHEVKKINAVGADVWTFTPSFNVNSGCTFESIKTDKSGNVNA